MSQPLKIGITCYPSIGGSGILASELGTELANRGNEVHFISYDAPFRMPTDHPRVFFHRVKVSGYDLFKYPDYTLPLSVKMAEVSRDRKLDVLHVHYAVPHATAAVLARSMLGHAAAPKIVATLHGTDTTLLGEDPGYGPAIRHALEASDGVTTVSEFLRGETQRLLGLKRHIDVIHNFSVPRPPRRTREEVRRELGLTDETLLFHASNLRPLKRVDLLLSAAARIQPANAFKLLILAGDDFAPFQKEVNRLGLTGRVIVRERVSDIEDYLQAADIGLFSSDLESFCLSILEAMCFACPSVATSVGGIPEVVTNGQHGILVPPNDAVALATAVGELIRDPARRSTLGAAGQRRAAELFSADAIVPRYEKLYRRICEAR